MTAPIEMVKVGSPCPDQSTSYSDASDNDELSERLREMDISDLLEQRDVFTRQIATSLVALHQLNQELDRRRRRKSYKNFRRKDATATPTWSSHQIGNYFFKVDPLGLNLLQHMLYIVYTDTFSKLRRCGPTNGIIDNLGFKLAKFDHRLRYKSDSKTMIEATIEISI